MTYDTMGRQIKMQNDTNWEFQAPRPNEFRHPQPKPDQQTLDPKVSINLNREIVSFVKFNYRGIFADIV